MRPCEAGSTFTSRRNTGQATKTVTNAMLMMFNPSALSPPSANISAWTMITTDTASAPVYGPTRIAASAPPNRCPLVPAATGKFSIWTAKM